LADVPKAQRIRRTADPLAEIGQREAVKRRFVRAFGIFANVMQLTEGGDFYHKI
jgi:hypothetical protein